MVVNIISVNVRGIRNPNKRRKVFNFYRPRCDVLCLQETHSSIEDEELWANEWGGSILYSHGTNNSRGVAILIKRSRTDIDVKKIYADADGRILLIEVTTESKQVLLCNIYAPNVDSPGFFH